MAKCKYESKSKSIWARAYICTEEALPESKDGFCIFHEQSKDKDIEKFNAGIKQKIKEKKYNFTGYYFPEKIDFAWQAFERIAMFVGAKFQGEAWFAGAQFQRLALFADAQFQADAWFDEAKFEETVSFEGAKFQDCAWFRGAEFQSDAWFHGAQFQGLWAWFDGAKFQGEARFDGAKFQDQAPFMSAEFGLRVSFRNACFESRGHAQIAYRKAKISYQREGDYAEAGYYRLLEMRARRKQRNSIIKALEFLFVDLTCGYGEQWWRVIFTALALVFGCALLYYFFFPITSPDIQITGIGWGYFKDCLYFSFVTFTTLGYGDLRPMPEVWTRAVASIEAFTGAFMIALFVLCFARKWMR